VQFVTRSGGSARAAPITLRTSKMHVIEYAANRMPLTFDTPQIETVASRKMH